MKLQQMSSEFVHKIYNLLMSYRDERVQLTMRVQKNVGSRRNGLKVPYSNNFNQNYH